MKAIDFAARFLKSLNDSTLTIQQAACLACVCAGVKAERDIARFLGYPSIAPVNRCAQALANNKLLEDNGDFIEREYKLTEKGKQQIAELLNFMPSK